MRILHITPFFYPAHVYGGPIPVLYDLCCESVKSGCDVKVLTTNANGKDAVLDVPTDREVRLPCGVSVRYCRRIGREAAAPGLLAELVRSVQWADAIHLSTAYSFPVIPTLIACTFLSRPLVWTPMGALQHWRGSRRLRLKSHWERICRFAAPENMVVHVTSATEESESRNVFPAATFVTIPHGVYIPEMPSKDTGGELRLLFLGRLDPKKGLENLLEACSLIQPRQLHPDRGDWSLTIAGSGAPEYVDTIRARIEALGLSQSVRMVGQVAGAAKEMLFAHADILVVPSHTENFAMVVVEALARGVPVLASTGTPWSRLPEKGCGMWVDNAPEQLAVAIHTMSGMDFREMGLRARRWMQEEFAWPAVAADMLALYRERRDSVAASGVSAA